MSSDQFKTWLTCYGYNVTGLAEALKNNGHPGSVSEIKKMIALWVRGVLEIPPGIVVALNLLGRMR